MHYAKIIFDSVSKQLSHELLFHHISMTFYQATSYAIQGVSGTGKSTLLSLIGNLDEPTSGNITYNIDNKIMLPHEISNNKKVLGMGYLFQQPRLIKELSVIENIQLPGLLNKQEKKYCKERAHILLNNVHLSDKAYAYPAHLSVGELQRVSLARALFNQPLFLIADEPTASLDSKTAHEIITLLQQLQKEWNMGLIIATHDTAIAHMLDERYSFYEKTLIKQQ